MQTQCVMLRGWPAFTAPRSKPTVQSTEPCSIGFLPSTPSSASTHVPAAPLPFLPLAHVSMPNSSPTMPPLVSHSVADVRALDEPVVVEEGAARVESRWAHDLDLAHEPVARHVDV